MRSRLLTPSANPIIQRGKNPIPVFFDVHAQPESQLTDYVDAEGMEKLKGLRRVLMTQFRVEYQLRAETRQAHGYTVGNGKDVSVFLHLRDIDDRELQRITDLAYQDFLHQMAAAGVEVIGPDRLASEPEFSAVSKLGKTSPAVLETRDGLSHFFAPDGGKVYTLLRKTDSDRQGFGSSSATASEDPAGELPNAELALSRKFHAPCMKVLLTIAPGQTDVSEWNNVGGLGDAVTLVKGSARVLPVLTLLEESRIVFRSEGHSANDINPVGGQKIFGRKVRDFTQEGDSAIYLQRTLAIADPVTEKSMEDLTGAGSKTLNAATKVDSAYKVGSMLGLGRLVPFGGEVATVAQVGRLSGDRERYEYGIHADTRLFEAAAGKEISAAIRLLLTRARQAMAAD